MVDTHSMPASALAQDSISRDFAPISHRDPTVRHYTVTHGLRSIREPDGCSVPAPMLRLRGAWLKRAGFTIGVQVTVRVSTGRLVIEVAEPQGEALDRLHKDFYPKPVKMTVTDKVQLDKIDVPYLTKADLKKLTGICGDKLHRGSPEKYRYNPTPDRLTADRQTIIDYGNKAFRLMESYVMAHRDNARHILCRFRERDVPVEVWFAAAANNVAAAANRA
ncbi:MAG: SymE family type I addiction module toxin [Steroidobacteraceae bacterium]